MSLGWVKKWKKRLQEAEPEDEQVLHSRSRARTHLPERISQAVTDRIIQMRDEPPEGLQRTPGQKRDPVLSAPRSRPASRAVTTLQPDDLSHLASLPDVSLTSGPTYKRSWRVLRR
jgi:hypothetical protein